MVGGTIRNMLHFEMLTVTQPGFEMITARVVIAARGSFEWQRELTPDRLQRGRVLVGRRQRDTGKKAVGVRVPWPGKQRVNRALFDNFTGVHHEDPVTGL